MTAAVSVCLSVKQAWAGGTESYLWWSAAVDRSHAVTAEKKKKKEVVTVWGRQLCHFLIFDLVKRAWEPQAVFLAEYKTDRDLNVL